jgi:Mg-chelatase subunit ChlD
VETRSQRIVFVLDRSGSMQFPASDEGRSAGPVTPGRPGDEPPAIEGDTKIEVARNQLARSIRMLSKDVYFNVVFFSSDVKVWKAAPEMLPATPDNKKQALDWFMKIEAVGATRTFDALLTALDYAAGKNGADTIFLLSDGSPTEVGGRLALTGEALEAEYAAFLEKNSVYKCVVHTIGVGPRHNRGLMRRIAKDTGGTYRGVGTN